MKNKYELNTKSKELMKLYRDRGMIKWQPFAALENHGQYIKNDIIERLKIPKPILTEDETNKINDMLNRLNDVTIETLFKVYSDGFIDVIITSNYKINKNKQTIKLDEKLINFDLLLDIIIKET